MLKIGILVCIHGNKAAARKLVKRYLQEKVDAIILAGDLGDNYKEIKQVLSAAKTKEVPVYVFPGSHEPPKDYYKAIKELKTSFIDCTKPKNRRVKTDDAEIVFLPGSDFIYYTGGFKLTDKRSQLKKYYKKLTRHGITTKLHPFSIEELRRYVKQPKKTLVIMHVPPKFKTKKAIDVARFCVAKQTFILSEKHHKKLFKGKGIEIFPKDPKGEQQVIPLAIGLKMKKLGYPIGILEANRGNECLAKVLNKLKIEKFICGHIHEAGQRGTTGKGKPVDEGTWSKELFYNASPAKEGKGGIYYIMNGKAMYKNITV